MEGSSAHLAVYAAGGLVGLYAVFLLRQILRELRALNQFFRRPPPSEKESSRSGRSSSSRGSSSQGSSSQGSGGQGSGRGPGPASGQFRTEGSGDGGDPVGSGDLDHGGSPPA